MKLESDCLPVSSVPEVLERCLQRCGDWQAMLDWRVALAQASSVDCPAIELAPVTHAPATCGCTASAESPLVSPELLSTATQLAARHVAWGGCLCCCGGWLALRAGEVALMQASSVDCPAIELAPVTDVPACCGCTAMVENPLVSPEILSTAMQSAAKHVAWGSCRCCCNDWLEMRDRDMALAQASSVDCPAIELAPVTDAPACCGCTASADRPVVRPELQSNETGSAAKPVAWGGCLCCCNDWLEMRDRDMALAQASSVDCPAIELASVTDAPACCGCTASADRPLVRPELLSNATGSAAKHVAWGGCLCCCDGWLALRAGEVALMQASSVDCPAIELAPVTDVPASRGCTATADNPLVSPELLSTTTWSAAMHMEWGSCLFCCGDWRVMEDREVPLAQASSVGCPAFELAPVIHAGPP